MESCIICAKHKQMDHVIYEDNDWIVSHGPIESQILGYLYLEPKRHVEHWGDFREEELSNIGLLIKRAEMALKQELMVDRVYTVTISEAVRHIHFHLIPRVDGEETKGLPLIEQATQKKIYTPNIITENVLSNFVANLKNNF